MKTCTVSRFGAWGDHICASIIYPYLKADGYHVTLNLMKRALPVVLHNPYIDKLWLHDESIPNEKLKEHWEEMAKGCDKFVNLSESIEGTLLKVNYREDYNLPKEELDKLNNINYYDRTMEIAGYDIKGETGHLYFSKQERRWAEREIMKHQGKFIFMWCISGSSFHKVYPYTEMLINQFLDSHPDSVCYTVGDNFCMLLENDFHPRWKTKSGRWDIRTTMLMTKYVNLVVGTETGVLNAAGCFNTPKIILLSHSTHENLSKYWQNCYPIHADVPCYPCHKLHYDLETCPLDLGTSAPVCMAKIKSYRILDVMEEVYRRFKYGNPNTANSHNLSYRGT